MKKSILLLSLILTFVYCKDSYYYENGKKVYISPVVQIKSFASRSIVTSSNLQYFKTPQNIILGMSDEILIKTTANIDIILAKHNIILLKQITSTIYLIKVKDKSFVLDIANRLYEDDSIEFAHPNFTKKIIKR